MSRAGGNKGEVLAALKRLYHVLKPEAFLVGLVSGRYAIAATEIERFTPSELNETLETIGFHVEKSFYHNPLTLLT